MVLIAREKKGVRFYFKISCMGRLILMTQITCEGFNGRNGLEIRMPIRMLVSLWIDKKELWGPHILSKCFIF